MCLARRRAASGRAQLDVHANDVNARAQARQLPRARPVRLKQHAQAGFADGRQQRREELRVEQRLAARDGERLMNASRTVEPVPAPNG